MEKYKFGACLPTFGSCADRFVLSGYGGGGTTVEEMLALATQVPKLEGVELVGNWHINDNNIQKIKRLLSDMNLKACMLVPDLWTQAKWGKGSFASPEEKTRKEAIVEVKKVMDWAVELNCKYIDLWFGQDGYDYCFQADFESAWENLAFGVAECADYRKDIFLCIEYKIKEPRTHIHVGTVGKTLLLVNEIARENVGVLLDVGHALAAGENVAESIALLHGRERKKLFYLHFNDNYRAWDDDMMVGSVHTIEYLELLYWLKRVGYEGWLTLDIFPYREDGVKAAKESIAWIGGMFKILWKIGDEQLSQVIASGDATEASRLIRTSLLPCETD
jgi:xylose isomerase